MEEGQIVETVLNEEYVRIVPGIGYYLKSKNISSIFKSKCPTFATTGGDGRIYLFSNSLEYIGSLSIHKTIIIRSLCALSNRFLASGLWNSNIKIWDIEERALICTLSGHRNIVTTLCYVRERVFVSGSDDKSLIIWSKLPGSNIYSQQMLKGHKSQIRGIIRINNSEIISGEFVGDLRIWNIDQGVCIRHLQPSVSNIIHQMRQYMGEIVLSDLNKISVWGEANNWGNPLKQFNVCTGFSIEFLSGDILLRGGCHGELEFIDYAQTGCAITYIQGLHSNYIYDLKRIAKNIVVSVSMDGSLKVIDPILRKCYLNWKKGDQRIRALASFY